MPPSTQATSASPLVPPVKNKRNPLTSIDFWAIWLVPLVLYIITVVIYNFFFYTSAVTCMVYTLLATLLSLALILQRERSKLLLPVGITCVCAVLAGTVAGLYCYDTYGIFTFFYKNSRKYTNVVPSEPSAAVADAGRLVFTDETTVDQTKSVGYAAENGHIYCAAPIHDAAQTARVEYWAVGFDCCGWESEFNCDASSNSAAHSGIVVFDNNGWFAQSRKDYYDTTRKKAEAEFDLASVEKPLYVRWVTESELDMLSSDYSKRSWLFLVFSSLGYALLTGFMSQWMYKL